MVNVVTRLGFVAFLVIWLPFSRESQTDPKALLRFAAAQYRDMKSFYIEFATTVTSSTPYSHGWTKQQYVVAGSDYKFHWEQGGAGLRAIRISDGNSEWFYLPGMHQYSVRPTNRTKIGSNVRGTANGTAEGWIGSAIYNLQHLDENADAAILERDVVLNIARNKVACHVVHSVHSMSFRAGADSTREYRYWIETATGLVRKAVLITSGPVSADDDEDDKTRVVETTYTKVDLHAKLDSSLFQFEPPSGAYLLDDDRQATSPSVSAGSSAPELKLPVNGETAFDLSSLRGKVVLIDFWASWCGACVEEMKAIEQLPQSYNDNGLVVVSVDEDEIPERGDGYFSSHKFHWKNLHDPGQIFRKTWGVSAFPLLVLVDRDGKVAWTKIGTTPNMAATLGSQLNKPELRLTP